MWGRASCRHAAVARRLRTAGGSEGDQQHCARQRGGAGHPGASGSGAGPAVAGAEHPVPGGGLHEGPRRPGPVGTRAQPALDGGDRAELRRRVPQAARQRREQVREEGRRWRTTAAWCGRGGSAPHHPQLPPSAAPLLHGVAARGGRRAPGRRRSGPRSGGAPIHVEERMRAQPFPILEFSAARPHGGAPGHANHYRHHSPGFRN
mmetsp:Transcript_9792/g.28011  ORF Transcript_9792/g.28011 Transcript_9792/m.28011 type:complete len:205 (-) Transcript_9792:75-689(-)